MHVVEREAEQVRKVFHRFAKLIKLLTGLSINGALRIKLKVLS